MIKRGNDVVLNVRPLIITLEHLYYYEGPCRFGKGDTLQPGYDRFANEEKATRFLDGVRAALPTGCELLEPVRFTRDDNWLTDESQWEAMEADIKASDAVVVLTGIGCGDVLIEFAERFKKPVLVTPISTFSDVEASAALSCRAINKYEVFGFYRWPDFTRKLRLLRARKVIQNTRMLCATRFGSTTSFASVDAFNSYDLITNRLGVRFRFINIHELFDYMTPATPEGNHTTPGRVTPNVTEADLAEAERICDELIAGAENNKMSKELMMPSAIFYVTVRKVLDWKDCNSFAMPCPDCCSTRRLNQIKFTPCLTHALNIENGIPSACGLDTDAALSQMALMAVSGMLPYMGNAAPVPVDENGKLIPRSAWNSPETFKRIEELGSENIYLIHHSDAHRRMPDPSEDAPYSIANFAQDQKFGVTIKYDFNRDIGKKITWARFSPDGSKLVVGSGEIVGGDGYDGVNCSTIVYFRVKDQADTHRKQCLAGNHLCMVYGDYVKDLAELAELLGIEAVVAD